MSFRIIEKKYLSNHLGESETFTNEKIGDILKMKVITMTYIN